MKKKEPEYIVRDGKIWRLYLPGKYRQLGNEEVVQTLSIQSKKLLRLMQHLANH